MTNQPSYAVIFSSQLSKNDTGYNETASRMVSLAKKQPGFLSVESVRDKNGSGITISYWASLDAIKKWKKNLEHIEAQKQGKEQWYDQYKITICKVEKRYGASKDINAGG